jgi:hypothetical protein
MASVSEFVLNYVVNASWQVVAIVVVAAGASCLLRNGPARYRHMLWLATLALCLVVPLLSAAPTPSPEKSVFTSSAQTPVTAPMPVNHEPDLSLTRLTTRRARVVSASPSTALWLTLG